MAIPQEHQTYLQQKGYRPRCPDALSAEEADILFRYGYWLEALALGVIAPTTPEQTHFVQVVRGEAGADTPFERIWMKLQDHLGVSAPRTPGERWDQAGQTAASKADHPQTKFEQLAEAKKALQDLRGCIEAEREEILKGVREELAALDAKYADQLREAGRAVAELESEVKAVVLQLRRSLRVGDVQAIFYRGRVTWDSRGLARYAEGNPEVEQFRKVGAPSVVVRYR